MNGILLLINHKKKEAIAYAKELIIFLNKQGKQLFLEPSSSQFFHESYLTFAPLNESAPCCDFILTIGGDGTLMHGARTAISYQKPIIGVNLGRVGFLATLEKKDHDKLIEICTGRYKISKRMLLDIQVVHQKKSHDYMAINDAVISKGNLAKVIDIDVYHNNRLLSQYRCDGLIASTPTGSTAYSLSAGGSIISPNLQAINVTPICSHSMFNKSIIFDDSSILCFQINEKNQSNVYLTIDGKESYHILEGDQVIVKKSTNYLYILEHESHDYYHILNKKFIEKGFRI